MTLRLVIDKDQHNRSIKGLRGLMKHKCCPFVVAVVRSVLKLAISTFCVFGPLFKVGFCEFCSLLGVEFFSSGEFESGRVVEDYSFGFYIGEEVLAVF